jgi:phage/plasmid-associated DNA primase
VALRTESDSTRVDHRPTHRDLRTSIDYHVHDWPGFWLGYCRLAQSDVALHLAELPVADQSYGYVAYLAWTRDGREGDSRLAQLATLYRYALLSAGVANDNLLCAVVGTEAHELKQTLRLYFPYALVSLAQQVRARDYALFHFTEYSGDLPVSVVLDLPYRPLYGSTALDEPVGHLRYLWHNAPGQDLRLAEAFFPQNLALVRTGVLEKHTLSSDLPHWLPLFFSQEYYQYVPPTTEEFIPEDLDTDDHVQLAYILLPLVGDKRLLEQSSWLDVGRALHTTFEGGSRGEELWQIRTEQALKRIMYHPSFLEPWPGIVSASYHRFDSRPNTAGVTYRTLGWWAERDHAQEYQKWHDQWQGYARQRSLSGHDTDLAHVFHRDNYLRVVTVLGTGNRPSISWYIFNRAWQVDSGAGIRTAVSGRMRDAYQRMQVTGCQASYTIGNERERDQAETVIRSCIKIADKLGNYGKKLGTTKELADLFECRRFPVLLDSNPDLLGVRNGLLAISGNTITFRETKPEDYVFRRCSVCYHAGYTWRHPQVQACLIWLRQLFPNEDTFHYFLKFGASCLRGGNNDKRFFIWEGPTGGSKSTVTKLFECTFGPDLCLKMPTEVVTGKRNSSSGPRPEMARTQGARIGFIQELDERRPVQTNIVKTLASIDTNYWRGLYSDGGDVVSTIKYIVVVNKMPPMDGKVDMAAVARADIMPMYTVYSDLAPRDPEQQRLHRHYPSDPDFDRKIPDLAAAFLWIIVMYYPYYHQERLRVKPAEVAEANRRYWFENDPVSQWIVERIDLTENKAHMLDLNTLHQDYTGWHHQAFPDGRKPLARGALRADLLVKWPTHHQGVWLGVQFKRLAPTSIHHLLR